MDRSERERFDGLLEEVLEALPGKLRALLEEVPLIVDDRPDGALLEELKKEWGDEPLEDEEYFGQGLCGLHTGLMLTERSVEHSGGLPEDIRVFREGVVWTAGGWEADGESAEDAEQRVYEEIWVTVLHEIGHHFGLDEDDLADLGYD